MKVKCQGQIWQYSVFDLIFSPHLRVIVSLLWRYIFIFHFCVQCTISGSVPLHIISGGLALRFGFKNFLMITSLIAALLTISFPLLMRSSYIYGLVSRILLGALHSGWFPGTFTIWLILYDSCFFSNARSMGSLVSKRRNVSIAYDNFCWSHCWCYDCHITRWRYYRALWLAAYVLFFGWTDSYLGNLLVFFSLWLAI